ncbi:UNKNOWN [Stylonychia lemnae]|uniref:Serine aminopeptidase S33 domain-containing protein n=1 Tax=Stylonychia lemnae TaxID=5949 RepID=A0A078AFM7_STYLE|nr:UNKNOWN [Stylonychia lemnae]|eukprot:CDW79718.1 UNKNOWN [Stylonychia lemnae]
MNIEADNIFSSEEKKQDLYYNEIWPEIDPLQLRVEQDGKIIKLQTYRHPVSDRSKLKGVVFYIHGYGGYCEHMEYMFKHFANAGYDAYAMDQRGFGRSEGLRSWIESQETMYSDLYLFIFAAIQKYKINLQKTPLFLLGKSFGGLLSFNISSKMPTLIRGMALVVPFFKQFGDSLYRYEWLFRSLDYINPKQNIKMKSKVDTTSPYYQKYKHYFTDPYPTNDTRSRTLLIFIKEQEEAFKAVKEGRNQTPIVFVLAGKDDVVRNSTTKEIYSDINNAKSKIIEYPDADHSTITIDEDISKKMAFEIILYFDSLL